VERAWRWARRRPLLAGLGSAIALLLLALVVGSWVAVVQVLAARDEERLAREDAQRRALEETAARGRAEEAEQQALAEARKAQKMSEVLVGMFQRPTRCRSTARRSSPGDAGRRSPTRSDRGAGASAGSFGMNRCCAALLKASATSADAGRVQEGRAAADRGGERARCPAGGPRVAALYHLGWRADRG
jgi:hypothetical protein